MNSISIIVPVYNSEKYLKNCINSILKQDYKNFELILVDNGSSDNSNNIIKEYTDKRIKILHLSKPSVSIARNEGLKIAKNDYVLFVDADDTLEEEGLKKIDKILSEFKVDVVVFNYYEVYKNKKIPKKLPWKNIVLSKNIIDSEYLPKLISNKIWGGVWRVIIKKDVLSKNKISFDKELKVAEDLLFNIEVFKCSKKIYISDEYLYNYYIYSTSTLNKYKENNIEQNIIFQRKLSQTLNKYNIYIKYEEELKQNKIMMYTSSISNAVRNENKREGYLEIKKIVKLYNNDTINYTNIKTRFLIKVTLYLMKIRCNNLIYILYFLKEKYRLHKSR